MIFAENVIVTFLYFFAKYSFADYSHLSTHIATYVYILLKRVEVVIQILQNFVICLSNVIKGK